MTPSARDISIAARGSDINTSCTTTYTDECRCVCVCVLYVSIVIIYHAAPWLTAISHEIEISLIIS